MAAHGPLRGEAITVKDWIDVAGFWCSGGELSQRDRRAPDDASAVARLLAAGAVVVAKTCVHVDRLTRIYGTSRGFAATTSAGFRTALNRH